MSRACRLRGNNGKDQRDRIVAVSPFRNLRQPAATANPLTVSDLSVVNTHGYESTGSEGQAIDWNKPARTPPGTRHDLDYWDAPKWFHRR